ncbi:MAG: SMP-30/gluconolactonase/LRE family protein [Pseudomonadota bacterium]
MVAERGAEMTTPVLSNLRMIGNGLRRPECVQAMPDGTVLCSDAKGGVKILWSDGSQSSRGDKGMPGHVSNGFAITPDGTVIVANTGPAGGLWTIASGGEVAPLVEQLDGTPNFVLIDHAGDIWFSVLTRADHSAPLSATRADGYIARLKDGAVEIMADGLISANEFRIDPALGALYVNETFARRTTRFDIAANGTLSNRQVLAEYARGSYPDGLALDEHGDLWVPCIIANQIAHVSKDGNVLVVYEERDPERVAEVQSALDAGTLTRDLIYQDTGATLNNPTSLAFGGPDLRTLYAGSITNTYLCAFGCSVAGQPMAHWTP